MAIKPHKSQRGKNKLARTRGPDADHPINRGGPAGVPKIKRAVGRPSEFHDELINEAIEFTLAGATDYELAEHLGIHLSTLYRWKHEQPKFREAVQHAKDVLDSRVEASLFSRAVGFTHKTEKVFCTDGVVTRVPTLEYVIPDTGAQLNWLKNRQPDRWRDKQDINLSGGIQVENVGDRDLALGLIQLLRMAGNDDDESMPAIEHEPQRVTLPRETATQQRKRREL